MEDLNNFEQMHHPASHSWGVDKKIPVALIFVVVTQILVFTWQAATLSNEVHNNYKAIERLEATMEKGVVRDNEFSKKFQEKFQEKSECLRIHNKLDDELGDIEDEIDDIDDRVQDIERTRFTQDLWDDRPK